MLLSSDGSFEPKSEAVNRQITHKLYTFHVIVLIFLVCFSFREMILSFKSLKSPLDLEYDRKKTLPVANQLRQMQENHLNNYFFKLLY